MFLLAPIVPYSSAVQQPIRATAVLGERPQSHWAARLDREQGRAAGLHPEGRCAAGYGNRSFMMYALCLLYHSGSSVCGEPDLTAAGLMSLAAKIAAISSSTSSKLKA